MKIHIINNFTILLVIQCDMFVNKKTYTTQENGQVTLPVDFRKKYGLKKGDIVVFEETEDGLPISMRESMAMKRLDEIGKALQAKGINLDDLIDSCRDIRQEF